ncbi:hypothetical protein [Falsibacillus albus]|uniref:Uncharacterized protein n=1 Tax=Falsibacillus albus TaxID=2478915 RepID=A0A3L7K5P4_9BACI|nr:hypothetical protein [Falsibacillus albus]RLQ98160.1 hypothetical protein D9X91_01870 [Falsibacillus albus]
MGKTDPSERISFFFVDSIKIAELEAADFSFTFKKALFDMKDDSQKNLYITTPFVKAAFKKEAIKKAVPF